VCRPFRTEVEGESEDCHDYGDEEFGSSLESWIEETEQIGENDAAEKRTEEREVDEESVGVRHGVRERGLTSGFSGERSESAATRG